MPNHLHLIIHFSKKNQLDMLTLRLAQGDKLTHSVIHSGSGRVRLYKIGLLGYKISLTFGAGSRFFRKIYL
jgi:hypothetical protein